MFEDKTADIVTFLNNSGLSASIHPNEIVLKKGKKAIFNLENRELIISTKFPKKAKTTYSFDQLDSFELLTDERYADATPFHDGNKEYIYEVRLNLIGGKVLRLYRFLNRDPEGGILMKMFMETLQKIIA